MHDGDSSGDPVLKKRKGASSSSSSVRSGGGDTATSSSTSLASLTPTTAWKAHAHCVSAAAWMSTSGGGGDSHDTSGGNSVCASAVTASWDHSIKTWDVERQVRKIWKVLP